MNWPTTKEPLIFYEGEDEETLISEYVALRVKLNESYTPYDICEYIFRNLKDGFGRHMQAADVWVKSIEIDLRIIAAKNNGGVDPKQPLTKAQWQAKMLAIVENDGMSPQDKTARGKLLTDYASSEGWIIKAVDKKVSGELKGFPTWVYEVPSDAIG